jgi:hypothetical protein
MQVEAATNPPEVAQLSPEARLEALFSEKPAQEAEADAEETEQEAAEVEQEEAAEGQAEAEPTEEAEETADIEVDGETYAVPKKLEAAFLKSKDYTQKTQELAEQRRVIEEREQFSERVEQARAAIFEKAVEVKAMEAQIKRFEAVDWNSLAEQGGPEYLRLDRAYRELREQHSQARVDVQALVAKHEQESAQQRQQLSQRGNEELAKAIKGWSPEVGRKLMESTKVYGFTDAELSRVNDPRYVRVLHDAHQWRELQKAKTGIVKKKVEQSKPITVKAARTTQNSQEASLYEADRARLKKTGNAKDAEAALARLFERKRKR